MDEYINREAARPDAFCSGVSCPDCPFLKSPLYGGCRIDDFIASIPAADVKPMVRGKWLLDTVYPSGVKKFRCSICGYDRTVHEKYEGVFQLNYCPNCGADMRQGADDVQV